MDRHFVGATCPDQKVYEVSQTALSIPLLSVIIPTHKRAQFLPLAIDSALQSAPDGNVEVIVVPNGSDESWRTSANLYKNEPKVHWCPISIAHANAARNHGMRLAKGEYIRFLDDDDYFYPESARAQLSHLMDKCGDLSFADIEQIDTQTKTRKILHQIKTDDYYAAVLSPTNSTATNALVYRRELTEDLLWDISINKNQDIYWALSLCEAKKNMKTVRFDGVVGAWIQHHLPRVSKGHHPNIVSKEEVHHIFKLTSALSSENQLTQKRAEAAADHLWQCIHKSLMYDPLFWIGVAKKTEAIARGRNPGTKIYQNKIISAINPIFIEITISPWRWIKVLFGKKYTT